MSRNTKPSREATRTSLALPILFGGAVLATGPTGASAQDLGGPPMSDVVMEVLAEETYLQATTVSLQPGQWELAAELYLRSAALMPPDDPRSFESSLSAAQILHSLGEDADVIAVLVAAAELAHRYGQVMNAAQAYLLAAGVCAETGRRAHAIEYAEKGQQLSSSPHISAAERARILRWVGDDTTLRTVLR